MNKKSNLRIIKRAFDVVCASIACAVLAPLLILIACLIRCRLGSPIIYVALRVGENSKVFRLYKFRSMTNELDNSGQLLPDTKRITQFGKFLRNTSIDELPSLWNVLKGELSLVGPRPFSSLYLDRYTPEQNRRHSVTPGITGWSQINGRNSLTWEDKFQYDLWYIDNWSLRLDIWILLSTVVQVFSRKDTNYEGFVSAPEFFGTQKQNQQVQEVDCKTDFISSPSPNSDHTRKL